MAHHVTLTLIDKMRFRVRTGSGHDVIMDASSDAGGEHAGPRPMELVLAALAGCAAMDVISILRKMRQNVASYDVTAHGATQEEHPRVYTGALVTHVVQGEGLAEASVRRAVSLSMSRYCPVFAMLSPSVPIEVRYEIRDVRGVATAVGAVRLDEAGGAS